MKSTRREDIVADVIGLVLLGVLYVNCLAAYEVLLNLDASRLLATLGAVTWSTVLVSVYRHLKRRLAMNRHRRGTR